MPGDHYDAVGIANQDIAGIDSNAATGNRQTGFYSVMFGQVCQGGMFSVSDAPGLGVDFGEHEATKYVRPGRTSNRALRRRYALELLGRRSRSADNDVTPSNVGLPNARACSCSIDQNFGITTYEHTPFFGLPLAHDENRTYGITSPRLISRFVLSWLNGACGTTHARHNRTIPRFNQVFSRSPIATPEGHLILDFN